MSELQTKQETSRHASRILGNFNKRFTYVNFDSNNPEHLQAARDLLKLDRLHPTIRFNVPPEYSSVRVMIAEILADRYLSSTLS